MTCSRLVTFLGNRLRSWHGRCSLSAIAVAPTQPSISMRVTHPLDAAGDRSLPSLNSWRKHACCLFGESPPVEVVGFQIRVVVDTVRDHLHGRHDQIEIVAPNHSAYFWPPVSGGVSLLLLLLEMLPIKSWRPFEPPPTTKPVTAIVRRMLGSVGMELPSA